MVVGDEHADLLGHNEDSARRPFVAGSSWRRMPPATSSSRQTAGQRGRSYRRGNDPNRAIGLKGDDDERILDRIEPLDYVLAGLMTAAGVLLMYENIAAGRMPTWPTALSTHCG